METLPALFINITGEVSTNLPAFRDNIIAYIDDINTELASDDDFATAESDIKQCKKTEHDLKSVKEAALNQSADIKDTMDCLNTVSDMLRDMRLRLEKLVKSEKESRKRDIKIQTKEQIICDNYIAEKLLDGFLLPTIDYDALLDEALKGKKTIYSLEEAAEMVADGCFREREKTVELMVKNIALLNVHKEQYGFLFNDFDKYICMHVEYTKLMIEKRIADYKITEQKKIEDAKKEAVELVRNEHNAVVEKIENIAEMSNFIENATDEQFGGALNDACSLNAKTITVPRKDFNLSLDSITSLFFKKDCDYRITFVEVG